MKCMDFSNVRVGPSEEVLNARRGAARRIDSRINEIRHACGIEINDVIRSDSWFLEVIVKPTVTLELHKRNRLDLAFEHVVLDPAWAAGFSPELRARAKR